MIPRGDLDLSTELPAGWPFWVPSVEERHGDEGFGYFRDTWVIGRPLVAQCGGLLDLERGLAELVDTLAEDEAAFNELTMAVEGREPDYLPDKAASDAAWSAIVEYVHDDETAPGLDGLELGVAGLAYSLGTVGCWPAASCRGHPEPRPWSPYPVVYFAADELHVQQLMPLITQAGCGLSTDPDRSNLLIVVAPSVTETMALARLVFDNRASFRTKRQGSRRHRGPRPVQAQLF